MSSNTQEKVNEVVDMAGNAAADAKDALQQTGASLRDTAGTYAADAVEIARGAASAGIDSLRGAAASGAETARDTLVSAGERIADTLRASADGTSAVQSRVMSTVADSISSVADTLRNRSVNDLIVEAQAMARRNPGAFAAGAAVAGFALARFLRSSARQSTAEQRAMERTEQFYRDAARRTMDTMGRATDAGLRS